MRVRELADDGVLSVGDGYRAKNDELGTTGFPFARAGNIDGGFHFEGADCLRTERVPMARDKISLPGDVVFTSKGTVGRFAFVSDATPRFIYSPQLCFWRSTRHDLLDPRYLLFWMRSSAFLSQVNSVKGQTDMADYVSLRDQREMWVDLPPLRIQRAIAATLGALDDKIDLNRRMNETLEAMVRAIFKSWFVDFDPVRAKMEGRQPVGMDAETAALFPSQMVQSEMGDVPEGWRRRVADELTREGALVIGDGYRAKNDELGPDGVPFLRAGDIVDGTFVEREDHLLPSRQSFAGAKFSSPGDTVFTSKGTIGRFALVHDSTLRVVYSPQVCFWRPEPRLLDPIYLHHWMRSRRFMDQVDRVKGEADLMDYVSLADQRRMLVDTPPHEVQVAFRGVVGAMEMRIAALRDESGTLGRIRDTLLPRLLSGELRIRDAERLVEAAT